MSRTTEQAIDCLNAGGWQQRPEPLHLNLDVKQEAQLVAAIQVITDAGMRVVPADWKVQ